MKILLTFLTTVIGMTLAALLWAYSGLYDMGADRHHLPLTSRLIAALRDRSIATHSKTIEPPDLNDASLVLKGAGQYASMCTGCHLAPGMKDTEMRPGLYPLPPNLSRVRVDPKAAFWVIKHGVKMSAMPAWGASHDDAAIWSIVAFVQKLPMLDAAGYKAIVAKAPPDEEMEMSMDGSGKEKGKERAETH